MVRFASTACLAMTLLPASFPQQLPAAQPEAKPGTAVESPATAASLQALLEKNDYLEFARRLPGAVGLRPEQAQYFAGTLAYREGRFDAVVSPLIAAVQARNSALTPSQVESAFEILGQTSAKTYLYGSSAKMYDDIDKLYGSRMGAGLEAIREQRHIGALLEQVPAQTVQIAGDFSIARTESKLGGRQPAEYPVTIGGRGFSAQLDTGASISLLAESTAKDWGVTLLDGTATLHGYGGGSFAARPGILPSLVIGKAELRSVVVFVTADRNLYIPEIKRQTHALLGYPVTSALGRLTFSRDGTLTVTAQAAPGEQRAGAPMWVGDGSLLVALGTAPVIQADKLIGGTETRLFELDTGSGSTYLTDHYLAENHSRFPGEPTSLARLAGAGGIHEIPAYDAHKLPLFFGATPVLCSGQHVLTQPQGGEAESYYGVIGQDILQLFSSYTLDFRNMRFSVTP